MTTANADRLRTAGFTDSQIAALGAVFTETVPTRDFWGTVKHFRKDEFSCNCGGKYCNGFPAEPDETLVQVLDMLRDESDAACLVSSGVRCSQWNRIVGGVSNSWHKEGKAADFCLSGKTAKQTIAMLGKYGKYIKELYAIDNSYVHMAVK